MKNKRGMGKVILVLGILCMGAMGCIRTTHEIKPIHITMDINLKVDRSLDDFFQDIDELPLEAAE